MIHNEILKVNEEAETNKKISQKTSISVSLYHRIDWSNYIITLKTFIISFNQYH